MTQKQIQTTLLDRLKSVDLMGTLLFAKANEAKTFARFRTSCGFIFLDTSLHCVLLSMTAWGVDSRKEW